MRQQLLVDLHSLTLQSIDSSFHIDGIPQGYGSCQERQSTGAIALIFRFSVPEFSQPVHKYRSRQRVTGFTFIQPRLYPPTQCRIAEPVEHKQSSFNTANFSQCFGQPVLLGVAGKLFQHQGCRHGSLLYRGCQTQHFTPVNFDLFQIQAGC
ncbi:Uncharacterised protein [Enterobacter hormaechei]|nr:Uncharacterised protein [Enterobacter hormaechei]